MMPGVAANQSKPPRRRGVQILLAATGFFILLAAGVLFRIETDRGTLVIECSGDNVPVEIRQGNVPVKQLSVSAGKNQVTLRSGEYEVIIPTEYETLHVESGKFELRRGDQWVARIVEEPPTQASGGRQSPKSSANDNASLSKQPESDTSSSPDYSLLSLQQLRELYSDEIQKANRLNEESLSLVATLGVDHPKVKDVSRLVKPVAERLQQLADAMSLRTTEPDPNRPDNMGVKSSEPANNYVPGSDSGLRFHDPLQHTELRFENPVVQINFERKLETYRRLLLAIEPLENKSQELSVRMLESPIDDRMKLQSEIIENRKQLLASLEEAEIHKKEIESMVAWIRLEKELRVALAGNPMDVSPAEYRAMFPETLIERVLGEAESAERKRQATSSEKTSQVFTTYPEMLCRDIQRLRSEYDSWKQRIRQHREILMGQGMSSLLGDYVDFDKAKNFVDNLKSDNARAMQCLSQIQQAVAELPFAIAEHKSNNSRIRGNTLEDEQPTIHNSPPDRMSKGELPTFQGRTFDEWKSILTTERSDEELAKAVEAIGTLGRGTREPEAIELIVKVVKQSPPVTSDFNSAPKSVLAAVRMIRAFDASTLATALIPGFADRSDRLQAFVVIGLMTFPDAYGTPTKETVRLGESLPVRQAMISSEPFVLELTKVIEKRSGLKTGDPALTQQVFSLPRVSNRDMVPIYAIRMTFEHIGKNKPGLELEEFLTRLLDHLAETPQDQKLRWEAQNVALVLVRVSPNEKLAEIFIRRIREEIVSANGSFVNHGGFGGGFSPGRSYSAPIDCFEGLLILCAHAESAIPLMLDIIGKPAPEGTPGEVPRPNQIFHEAGVVYLVERKNSDVSVSNADVSVIAQTHRGFAVNLRLLAMEVIASSGRKDSKVIDLLRAELKKQLGQEPTDGPHELLPGRDFLLLRDDPNAAWKGPGTTNRPTVPIPQSGGFQGTPIPVPTSPLDVELVNSTLLAWKSITGSSPRFAEPGLGQLGNRTPQELGQSEVNSEKTLEFLPKFQPVAGLQP